MTARRHGRIRRGRSGFEGGSRLGRMANPAELPAAGTDPQTLAALVAKGMAKPHDELAQSCATLVIDGQNLRAELAEAQGWMRCNRTRYHRHRVHRSDRRSGHRRRVRVLRRSGGADAGGGGGPGGLGGGGRSAKPPCFAFGGGRGGPDRARGAHVDHGPPLGGGRVRGLRGDRDQLDAGPGEGEDGAGVADVDAEDDLGGARSPGAEGPR